jgi:hypothetical protein
MFKYIIEIFLIGLLFRILFRYVLPIFRIASVTNSRLRQMHDQARETERRANDTTTKNNVKKEGDYIDYEEVK